MKEAFCHMASMRMLFRHRLSWILFPSCEEISLINKAFPFPLGNAFPSTEIQRCLLAGVFHLSPESIYLTSIEVFTAAE